jgi:hypothetical protein
MAHFFTISNPVIRIDRQVAFGKPNTILDFAQTLWERLARDSGVSVDIIIDCAGVIAGKPRSHRGSRCVRNTKKPLNLSIQRLGFNRIPDQAA